LNRTASQPIAVGFLRPFETHRTAGTGNQGPIPELLASA
jgi:hypothetical protein